MILTIDNVLTAGELNQLDAGLAATQFVDGRATAHGGAVRVKNNLQAQGGAARIPELQKLVLTALARNETFSSFALPRQVLPPMFNRYDSGMYYGDHIDQAVMPGMSPLRTDLAMTLFLSEDYDGGELVIGSDYGPQRVKLPRGSLVLYPASTIHRVEPVTRGSRLAAVTWVQSFVPEHERRQMLAELAQLKTQVEQTAPNSTQSLQLQKIRANLLRWWVDV
jgi:PKHD-type hydroxylase